MASADLQSAPGGLAPFSKAVAVALVTAVVFALREFGVDIPGDDKQVETIVQGVATLIAVFFAINRGA